MVNYDTEKIGGSDLFSSYEYDYNSKVTLEENTVGWIFHFFYLKTSLQKI